MPKFRKKPVVIEALQWITTNAGDIKEFVGKPIVDGVVDAMLQGECRFLLPEEITGVWDLPHVYDELHQTWVGVNDFDWIIRGVQGEFYPCRADVFEQTYEPA